MSSWLLVSSFLHFGFVAVDFPLCVSSRVPMAVVDFGFLSAGYFPTSLQDNPFHTRFS